MLVYPYRSWQVRVRLVRQNLNTTGRLDTRERQVAPPVDSPLFR